MALVAVIAAAAALAGIPGRATDARWATGDEPHYLLTAMSLGHDGDLDVSDEIAGGRYRSFHRPGLAPQGAERPDGSVVEPHDPLLPVLLALPMRWGGVVAAKATLAVLAGALAALVVWTMARRFEVPLVSATVTTVVFTAAAPLAVYGQQIYPELPAALVVVAAVAALTGRMRRGGQVVLVSAVVALPWLSVKYVPVAGVLAAIALVRLWRNGRRRSAVGLGGTLALASVAYVVGHLVWYEGVSVYASGRFFQEQGGQISVVGTAPDHLGRAQRLIGLLVDRGFGLAAWQPAWLLAVPAVAALVHRRPAGWITIALPSATGWLTATFVAATMHGWWFPGRQIVVVLPLLAIAVAWWAGASRRRLGTLVASGALGIASYAWLAAETARHEVTWVVDFVATSNPWYRTWRLLLPDHMRPGPETWALHVAWTAAIIALAVWGWRSGGRVGGRTGGSLGAGAGARTRPRAGAGPRAGSGAGPGGLAAAVELPDGGAVVGAARGEGEDEDGGGRRPADDRASHGGTSQVVGGP